MGPKGGGSSGSKDAQSSKAERKAKEKLIEDKTFGLKNKNKSAKVNKYVEGLKQNLLGQSKKIQDIAKADLKKKKEDEEQRKLELAALFKPVVTQPKLAFGVDPKSVVCVFFKVGQCIKGDKCKYSHDLVVERKAAKIDLYTDSRDSRDAVDEDCTADVNDSMDKWDQSKLEDVIRKKHGFPSSGMKSSTDIVCKFFLDAVEQSKYGWFWECPNGGDKCHYRHALPAGFVLVRNSGGGDDSGKGKGKRIGDGDDSDEISLEEFLEVERHKLGSDLTPVTWETFQRWKSDRCKKIAEEEAAKLKVRELEYKTGKGAGASGRELFHFQPDLFHVDDDEAMDVEYEKHDNSSCALEDDSVVVGDESLFMDELTIEDEDEDENKSKDEDK